MSGTLAPNQPRSPLYFQSDFRSAEDFHRYRVKFFQQAKIIQDTLTSGAVDSLVPRPVASDGVIRGEGREEMTIEFLGRGGGEPAKACQAVSFLVPLTIAADCVVRREDLEEMIGHAFVREFRKAA